MIVLGLWYPSRERELVQCVTIDGNVRCNCLILINQLNQNYVLATARLFYLGQKIIRHTLLFRDAGKHHNGSRFVNYTDLSLATPIEAADNGQLSASLTHVK